MSGAYEKVLASRQKGRATGLSYLGQLFEDFVELHGDRRFADDPAIVGGIARLGAQSVTVIAIEKGSDTKEKVRRNFGAPNPEGYRKALRLMKQAEKFRRPVICLVDTAGAFCGVGAEERGQAQAIAENLCEMMALKTPVISILIGEGGSGGALALAVADRVWILENATYSAISPEGCASILWRDAKKVREAAESLCLTAEDMRRFQVVEEVFSEQEGFDALCQQLRQRLEQELPILMKMDAVALTEQRYQRFRRIGPETLWEKEEPGHAQEQAGD